MRTPTDNDPPEVQQTRSFIKAWLAGILGDSRILKFL
jgi:hypothetical protein